MTLMEKLGIKDENELRELVKENSPKVSGLVEISSYIEYRENEDAIEQMIEDEFNSEDED